MSFLDSWTHLSLIDCTCIAYFPLPCMAPNPSTPSELRKLHASLFLINPCDLYESRASSLFPPTILITINQFCSKV